MSRNQYFPSGNLKRPIPRIHRFSGHGAGLAWPPQGHQVYPGNRKSNYRCSRIGSALGRRAVPYKNASLWLRRGQNSLGAPGWQGEIRIFAVGRASFWQLVVKFSGQA